jgi:hypothetical protein
METKTYRVFAAAIGRPGTDMYVPRQDFGTVQAPNAMRALDIVAERIGERHQERHQSIPVMGVGSVMVEEAA